MDKIMEDKPELKQKWLEALRSGEYKQGHMALREEVNGEDCFCCLGVLADILDHRAWTKNGCGYGYIFRNDNGAYLTYHVPYSETGLANAMQKTLAEMNDNGKSFSEIADFIEAN